MGQQKFPGVSDFLFILMLCSPSRLRQFYKALIYRLQLEQRSSAKESINVVLLINNSNYASASNIPGFIKFYNLGDKTSETDFSFFCTCNVDIERKYIES